MKTMTPAVYNPVCLEPKVLVLTGLPGSGKTSIALELAKDWQAVHFNADYVRATVNKDLKFSKSDRMLQAERLGYMSRIVADSGHLVVVDFVCPTFDTRKAFLDALGYKPRWVELTREEHSSAFEDTNRMYESMIPEENRAFLYLEQFMSLINKGQTIDEMVRQILTWCPWQKTK